MSAAAWYVVAPALAAIAFFALVTMRGARAQQLPLAGVSLLRRARRRTATVRLGLLAAIGGALAAAFVVAPRPTGELSQLVSSTRNTIVVLDVSQSVSDLVYREIARTLQGIVTAAGPGGRVGLVLFSDVAVMTLPPGSRAADLEPFAFFFRPKDQRGVAAKPTYYRTGGSAKHVIIQVPLNAWYDHGAGPTNGAPLQFPLNPWFAQFSAGTQISTGLRMAREALEPQGGGRVILLSDLQDASPDVPVLTRELVAWQKDPTLDLRIVALPPALPSDKSLFTAITGRPGAVVDSVDLVTGNGGAGEPIQRIPIAFLAAVIALAFALGARAVFGVPLRWRRSA